MRPTATVGKLVAALTARASVPRLKEGATSHQGNDQRRNLQGCVASNVTLKMVSKRLMRPELGDFSERRLFRVADLHASEAEETAF